MVARNLGKHEMRKPLFTAGRRPAAPIVTGSPRAPRIVSPAGNAASAAWRQQQGTSPISNANYTNANGQVNNIAGIANAGIS